MGGPHLRATPAFLSDAVVLCADDSGRCGTGGTGSASALRRAERNSTPCGVNEPHRGEIHDTLARGTWEISVKLEVLAKLLRMSKVDAAANTWT